MKLAIECEMCGDTYGITVSDSDYWDWQSGKLIQRAFPYLAPGERELLISNTCGECFDETRYQVWN